jgi:hypothetical protein
MNGTEALGQSLSELGSFFDGRSWKYCLVGGLAANCWGRPRFTQDIDITVYTEVGREADVIRELLTSFHSRLDRAEARQFAIDHRVLLLTSRAGIQIDVALGALGFEEQMVERAPRYEILPSILVPVATAEDVVIMKAIAGRPQDWMDIEGILAKQRSKLDWTYIDATLPPLLELADASDRISQLIAVKRKVEAAATLQTRPRIRPPDKKE